MTDRQAPYVRTADPGAEYFFEEGCWILELSNHQGDPELSVARARVPPLGHTEPHYLVDTTERYLILEGVGEVTVDGRTAPVGPGDIVHVPAGVVQCIRNTGTEELLFLALCTPRFKPDCYVAITEQGAT